MSTLHLMELERLRKEHYAMYVERAKRKGRVVKTYDQWLMSR